MKVPHIPAGESQGAPELPESVYVGPLGEYVEAVTPASEAPREFHYGALLAVLSAAFAHRYIRWFNSGALYPSLYVILAGRTGGTKKSSTIAQAEEIAKRLSLDLRWISGVGSTEGIMKKVQARTPHVWRIREFTTLLKKAGNQATASLTELVIDLYDRPQVWSNKVLGNPIQVEEPTVVILGDSTVEHLTSCFTDQSLSSGLLNRLSIFMGSPGDPLALPVETPNLNRTTKAVERAIGAATESEMMISSEATEWWEPVYRKEAHPSMTAPGGEAIQRLSDHSFKVAMIYASLRGSDTIEVDDLKAGWAVASYWADCATHVAAEIGRSERSQLLQGVREAVERHGPLPTPGYLKRNLGATLRTRIDDHGGPHKILTQLVADGEIGYDKETGYYALE